MDSKYENGKIYRLSCLDTGKYYIGSTIRTIEERLYKHKHSYKYYLNGKYHYVSSFDVLENNNYVIELVKNYPCDNKRELEKQEDIYIKKYMNDELCVNKQRAYLTNEERKENMKEYKKEYNKKNQDKIRERRKKNDKKNQDKIRERRKQRYTCLCGLNIRRCDIRRHLKSKIHHTTLLHLVKKKCSDIL